MKAMECCFNFLLSDFSPLQTRQLYFVTESALYELFKFAGEYSEDIIDALNEEGLTITAAQFDKVRKGLRRS